MFIIQGLEFSRIIHISAIEFINDTFILGPWHTMINAVLLPNPRGVLTYSQNLFAIYFVFILSLQLTPSMT